MSVNVENQASQEFVRNSISVSEDRLRADIESASASAQVALEKEAEARISGDDKVLEAASRALDDERSARADAVLEAEERVMDAVRSEADERRSAVDGAVSRAGELVELEASERAAGVEAAEARMSKVVSRAVASVREDLGKEIEGKQDALDDAQSAAVNSGITEDLVLRISSGPDRISDGASSIMADGSVEKVVPEDPDGMFEVCGYDVPNVGPNQWLREGSPTIILGYGGNGDGMWSFMSPDLLGSGAVVKIAGTGDEVELRIADGVVATRPSKKVESRLLDDSHSEVDAGGLTVFSLDGVNPPSLYLFPGTKDGNETRSSIARPEIYVAGSFNNGSVVRVEDAYGAGVTALNKADFLINKISVREAIESARKYTDMSTRDGPLPDYLPVRKNGKDVNWSLAENTDASAGKWYALLDEYGKQIASFLPDGTCPYAAAGVTFGGKTRDEIGSGVAIASFGDRIALKSDIGMIKSVNVSGEYEDGEAFSFDVLVKGE